MGTAPTLSGLGRSYFIVYLPWDLLLAALGTYCIWGYLMKWVTLS